MNIEEFSEVERLLIEKFGRLDVQEDELAYKHFITGNLDRFNRLLTNEECINLMILFNPRNDFETQEFFGIEEKFLEIFRYLFRKNGETPVYIYCPELESKRKYIFRYLKKVLDKQEFSLFKKIKNTIVPHNGLFEIKTQEHLEIFAKLSLRHLHFSNFFFEDSVIIGNYELNIPIYCFDISYLKECESEANKVGLYIRSKY